MKAILAGRLLWGRGKGDDNAGALDEVAMAFGVSLVKLDSVGDGVPDRLCGYRGIDFTVEYKNPKGHNHGKCELRPSQEAFLRLWRGRPAYLVRNADDWREVLAAVANEALRRAAG